MTIKALDSVDREAQAWLAELPGVDPQLETMRMRLLRLGRQMDRMLEAIARRHRMTLGDWETLSVLRRSGRPYTTSPGRLAEMLQVTSGTMSVRLERLQNAGLIERVAATGDARSRPVRLTVAGQRRWRKATAERTAIERRLLTRAVDGRAGVLNGLLRRLMISFESEFGAAPRRRSSSD